MKTCWIICIVYCKADPNFSLIDATENAWNKADFLKNNLVLKIPPHQGGSEMIKYWESVTGNIGTSVSSCYVKDAVWAQWHISVSKSSCRQVW